ncbi:MAG: preprotein translocase subunit SecG [Clostridiales bacterium]|nr:preprotein translocase subunit SecG [Clostridiales bacterium]
MIAIEIAMVVIAVVLIVSVLLQSSDDDGMGALTGASSESFFSKNQTSTLEGKLALITKIAAGLFVILALVHLIIA